MYLTTVYLMTPFLVFMFLGVPIAFSLGLSCLFFIAFSGAPLPIPAVHVITEMFSSLDQFAILALPMFVLTGELLTRCNIIDELIRLSRLLVGWIRGGLGHVVIVSSMFFSGISGSAVADIAAIGPILIPAMIRERFPRDYAAALTAAASIMGPVIPPSIPMIIVGAQLGISVGGLFAAGILPGILIGLSLMAANWWFCRRHGYGEIHRFEGVVPILISSAKATPALIIPVWLLGGILAGIFTPTEAGAVAVVYTALVGRFLYRTLDGERLKEALLSTAKITAQALLIVTTAFIFSRILTLYRVPTELLDLMLAISTGKVTLILILIVFFTIIGTFMDALATMIILGPLLMPVCVEGMGMHPLQYGMFLVVGQLLGLLTPPVGLSIFVAAPIANVSMERISIAVLPFLFVETVVLAVIAFVPELSLFIPRLVGLI